MGLKPGKMHATAAGVAEAGGGALLVTGLATPLGASALTGVMTVAVHKVHFAKGPWNTEGGYEYPLVLMAAAFMITADGPGALSIDRRVWGTHWAIAELLAGVGGAFAMLKLTDQGAPAESADGQQQTAEPQSA
jgi:putative oxidoreductase